jgi:hypothetical protein
MHPLPGTGSARPLTVDCETLKQAPPTCTAAAPALPLQAHAGAAQVHAHDLLLSPSAVAAAAFEAFAALSPAGSAATNLSASLQKAVAAAAALGLDIVDTDSRERETDPAADGDAACAKPPPQATSPMSTDENPFFMEQGSPGLPFGSRRLSMSLPAGMPIGNMAAASEAPASSMQAPLMDVVPMDTGLAFDFSMF